MSIAALSLYGAKAASVANVTTIDSKATIDSKTTVEPSTRYGLFGLMDRRSNYGQGVYPEPFLVDDTDLETNEARFDWEYTAGPGTHTNLTTAEVEKGFGLMTLEIEVPYEWDTEPGVTTHGVGNIDLGARMPFFEWVSKNGFVNTTFGTAIEVGIPTMSPISRNTELVPKLFNDITLGSHFSLQSIVGLSMLYGSGDDGGLNTFEYGFVFGYTFQHAELPIPFVDQFIPMFELVGETELNKDNPLQNSLTGDAGFRINLKAWGPIQPRLGFAFVFPMNTVSQQETHYGFVTSAVFEY